MAKRRNGERRTTSRIRPAVGGRVDLSVSLGALRLRNPVLVASGTYGYGEEYSELCDPSSLGGLMTKTITLKPRAGNPPPRIVETPSGLLNSIGLENVGVEAFLKEKLPSLRRLRTTVVVSIAGSSVAEYGEVAQRLSGVRGIDALEVNISCPNVQREGMVFGANAQMTREVISAVRRLTLLPLIAKLTPNVTAIEPIAQAAQDGGADILSLINTLQGMAIDIETRRPKLGAVTGGLSGPAIRPVAVAMVYRVRKAASIPIIGIGGIANASDALELMIAGASAVQIGSANFVDPQIPRKVIEGLREFCYHNRIRRISDLVGTLKITDSPHAAGPGCKDTPSPRTQRK